MVQIIKSILTLIFFSTWKSCMMLSKLSGLFGFSRYFVKKTYFPIFPRSLEMSPCVRCVRQQIHKHYLCKCKSCSNFSFYFAFSPLASLSRIDPLLQEWKTQQCEEFVTFSGWMWDRSEQHVVGWARQQYDKTQLKFVPSYLFSKISLLSVLYGTISIAAYSMFISKLSK